MKEFGENKILKLFEKIINRMRIKVFKNKTLLITGGTGSFGQKMLKFFINNTDIERVKIFSRDEEKQDRMRTVPLG